MDRISSLAFLDGCLYSSQAGSVYKWTADLSKVETSLKCESKKSEISQIIKLNDNLICASRKIKCYLNNELTYEWPGHTHPCVSLATAGEHLISYGQDENSVAVWKSNSEKTECRFQITGK